MFVGTGQIGHATGYSWFLLLKHYINRDQYFMLQKNKYLLFHVSFSLVNLVVVPLSFGLLDVLIACIVPKNTQQHLIHLRPHSIPCCPVSRCVLYLVFLLKPRTSPNTLPNPNTLHVLPTLTFCHERDLHGRAASSLRCQDCEAKDTSKREDGGASPIPSDRLVFLETPGLRPSDPGIPNRPLASLGVFKWAGKLPPKKHVYRTRGLE
jgi:hypothetical protein